MAKSEWTLREEQILRWKAQGGWMGVDLDGTLAKYEGFKGMAVIGEPILPMVSRVKWWRSLGLEVRIFTARAEDPESVGPIQDWCEKHLGERLPVTNRKDFRMVELWDDRAKQVVPNTGMRADRAVEVDALHPAIQRRGPQGRVHDQDHSANAHILADAEWEHLHTTYDPAKPQEGS